MVPVVPAARLSTALVVPFRFGDDPARDRAWQYVRGWYLEHHPRFHPYVGLCPRDVLWSKGSAVAAGMRRVPDHVEVVVVADADVIVPPDALEASVATVEDGAAWSQPHGWVYRLSRASASAVYTGTLPATVRRLPDRVLERRSHAAALGGGIVVVSREAYQTAGGPDPRFIGWGGDDVSWARALDTLAGPCARLDAPMWHLWHPRMERRRGNRASPESEGLAGRYLDAAGDVGQMRALVDEHARVPA